MLICVLPDVVIESYRTVGFPQTHDLFGKQKPDVFTADPYALLVEQGMPLRNVVRIGVSSYTISDVNDDPLPVAMNFDYMNGYIDESRYDLEKAAKLLLARDDVAIFKVDWRGHATDERVTTVEQAVVEIPHYNSERGRSRTINFVWMPSVEDYRRMWKQAASYGGDYGPSVHRYQAMFDADVLGLRAGGAARFDGFHKSAEGGYSDADD